MAAEPLTRLIQSIQFTDTEIKRLASNASKEADRIMSSLAGASGSGAKVRSAQVALAKLQVEMWAGVGQATGIGIGDAVYGATEYQALFDESLFSAAGLSSQYWRESMIAQAAAGIENLKSRKVNGYSLSDKVYKNTALSKGYVSDAINNGLALGKSVQEIASDVVGFIDPNVPGGASYAATRLARTEVNNAYHTTTINGFKKTPWVEVATWHLSGSHPVPDECNEYADQVHFTGGVEGQFKIGDIPGKPHPNCLCYLTPSMPPMEKYIKDFKSGKYDTYIEQQMGCYRGA